MNRPFGLAAAAIEKRLEQKLAEGFLPRGYIDGLTLANDTTDATNDMAIAPGMCRSTHRIVDGAVSTFHRHQCDIEIPVSIIKQIDVAWAPENYDLEGYSGGGRSGGRSSSSLADTTWHYFAIAGYGLPADVLIHDATDPSAVLPSGYNAWRNIMSLTRSTSLQSITQFGDDVLLNTQIRDLVNATPGTNANTATLTVVPTGVKTLVWMNIMTDAQGVYISSLDQADAAPSATLAPLASSYDGASTNGCLGWVYTNTAAQFRYRSSANSPLYISPIGYRHPRGKNV